jgi:hypothetical protein
MCYNCCMHKTADGINCNGQIGTNGWATGVGARGEGEALPEVRARLLCATCGCEFVRSSQGLLAVAATESGWSR